MKDCNTEKRWKKNWAIRVEILMNSSIGATEYSPGCKPTGKGVNPWVNNKNKVFTCPRQCLLFDVERSFTAFIKEDFT